MTPFIAAYAGLPKTPPLFTPVGHGAHNTVFFGLESYYAAMNFYDDYIDH